jgi:hypothetical protein
LRWFAVVALGQRKFAVPKACRDMLQRGQRSRKASSFRESGATVRRGEKNSEVGGGFASDSSLKNWNGRVGCRFRFADRKVRRRVGPGGRRRGWVIPVSGGSFGDPGLWREPESRRWSRPRLRRLSEAVGTARESRPREGYGSSPNVSLRRPLFPKGVSGMKQGRAATDRENR